MAFSGVPNESQVLDWYKSETTGDDGVSRTSWALST